MGRSGLIIAPLASNGMGQEYEAVSRKMTMERRWWSGFDRAALAMAEGADPRPYRKALTRIIGKLAPG